MKKAFIGRSFCKKQYVKSVKITPDLSCDGVKFDVEVANPSAELTCELAITFDGKPVTTVAVSCGEKVNSVQANLLTQDSHFCAYYWYPYVPSLYDVEIRLKKGGEVIDEAGSYFGLREIKTEGNKVLINKAPYCFKLVLDQGYFKESGLTAPSEEALYRDIELAKEMGFNGARKHQKIEDERYLYYADIMGFAVWCEMPSAYSFNDNMVGKMTGEWHQIVCQNYNHPSVLAWVPLNESWGVKTISSNKLMQAFADTLYYQTKAIDSMRPVISNDGWEHTTSDILTLHHYEQNPEALLSFYDTLEKVTEGSFVNGQKQPYADGYRYGGQPIIFSEYGGTAYVKDHAGENWGYGVGCKDEAELCARFKGFYEAIKKMPGVSGFCYTQLTDVFQEVNGLLDMDRKPKISMASIKEILSK